MAERTIRDFQCAYDVAPYADAWAGATHFSLRLIDPDGSRHYQRGEGILTGSMHAIVRQQGTNVRLEAWVHATLLARITALFLIPESISIESGGIRGVLPRQICRDAVNRLMTQLGQPLIA